MKPELEFDMLKNLTEADQLPVGEAIELTFTSAKQLQLYRQHLYRIRKAENIGVNLSFKDRGKKLWLIKAREEII